jgi:hypothetical protein
MPVTLKGADDLRARFDRLAGVAAPMLGRWAVEASDLMKKRVHSPSGRLRGSIYGESGERYGAVYGDYRLTFQDRGTKPHGPKNRTAMKFERGGDTVFAKRVRGVRKRPFIRKSAREALKGDVMLQEVIAAWNGTGGRAGRYGLGDITTRRNRARARRAG